MANPHIYFNTHLIGERENSVFYFRPTIQSSRDFLKNVVEPAIQVLELKLNDFIDTKHSTENIDVVCEAINRSRVLIFDLSMDPRCGGKVNANVAYELGVARSVREDRDIILLTNSEKIGDDIFFHVRSANILKMEEYSNSEDFMNMIKGVLKDQDNYEDKRIHSICRSVGVESIPLIQTYGVRPKGKSQFGTNTPMEQIAALRLLDLGVLYTGWDPPKGHMLPRAYDWTPLGREVVLRFGLKIMDEEDFRKSPAYKEYQESIERYRPYLEKSQ